MKDKKNILITILILLIFGMGLYITQLRSQAKGRQALQSLPADAASPYAQIQSQFQNCAGIAQQARQAYNQNLPDQFTAFSQQWKDTGCDALAQ